MKICMMILVLLLLSLSGMAQELPDLYFSDHVCNLTEPRTIEFDLPGVSTFTLLDGPGTINPETGAITYTPDTSGVFSFIVSAFDGDNELVFNVYDSLILNSPPQVYCNDSTVFLCQPEDICFDITASDSDMDYAYIFKLEGVGIFEQLDDSTGRTCFMPADVDSADYLFIFRAADSCTFEQNDKNQSDFYPCCRDTNIITVIINQPPEIECPEEIVITDTTAGEFCFDINSSGGDLSYNILSDIGYFSNDQVCFMADRPGDFVIVIEVVNNCGRADTCEVPVSIKFEDEGGPDFDIKPTSCPNPLNIKGNTLRDGSLIPAALLGTEDFDVRDIDPTSLTLEGVVPTRWDYEDVTAPADKSEDSCACTEDGPDGYEDLTLEFVKSDIISVFGNLYDGQIIELTITGNLKDGTPFEASDCMIIRAKKIGRASEVDATAEIRRPQLLGNQPNPFNPTTRISFVLPKSGFVKL